MKFCAAMGTEHTLGSSDATLQRILLCRPNALCAELLFVLLFLYAIISPEQCCVLVLRTRPARTQKDAIRQ
jgi:hypothetical protein